MSSRKEEIVEAASKRFSHFGFAKTTMNEIADDLRITKANLYYYYADKAALFRDVVRSIMDEIQLLDLELINGYNNNFIDIIYEWLELRSKYIKKHYVIYFNDNMECFRDPLMKELIDEYHTKDFQNLAKLMVMAKESGELQIGDAREDAEILSEIIKGIGVLHTMTEIFSGMMNKDKFDYALESQKKAIKFIFQGKIITHK